MNKLKIFFQNHPKLIGAIFLAAFSFLIHSNYLNNGFTWLDHIDIERQNAIVPLTHLLSVFFKSFGETQWYRPLTVIVYSLDFALYHFWSPGYHLTNLLIHLSTTILLFVILIDIFKLSTFKAVFLALLFNIYPLNNETVGAINARTDLLAAFFTMLFIYSQHLYEKKKTKKRLINMVLSAFFAFCSKETAIIWIFGALFLSEKRDKSTNLKKIRTFAMIVTAYLICRTVALSHLIPSLEPQSLNLNQYIFTHLSVLGQFLLRYLLLPLTPPMSDAIKIQNSIDRWGTAGICILIAYSFLIYRYRNNKQFQAVSSLMLLSLVPFFLPLPRLIQPHYGYFTTITIILVLGLIIRKNYNQKITFLLFGFLSIWGAIASVNTYKTGIQFKNDFTLFNNISRKDRHYKEAHFYLAMYYQQHSKVDKAIEAFQTAIKPDKQYISYVDDSAAKINIGALYIVKNDCDQAIRYLTQATRDSKRSDRNIILYNSALCYLKNNNNQKAITVLESIKFDNETPPEMILLLADSYHKSGRDSDALKLLPYLKGKIETNDQLNLFKAVYGQISFEKVQ